MASDTELNGVRNCEVSETTKLDDKKLAFWKKRRYHVVFMIYLGLLILLNLRIDLSVAIVAMTQKVNVTLDDGTITETQEFNWDSKTQGYILSSFFYGYVVSQFLGGVLSTRFGGHLIFGLSMGLTSVLALLTPIAAKTHLSLFIIVRILQGLVGGVAYPAIMAIWSQWAPVYERSFMGNVSYSGNASGIIAAMIFTGMMSVAWGWESVFYVFGAIGCILYIIWIIVVKANPEVDPFINEAEKLYIASSIGEPKKGKNIKHPWKDIFTSGAVWAIVVSSFVALWGAFTLMTQLPMFMNDTLGFDLNTTGMLAGVPYIVMICALFISGYLADWLQLKGYLTTGQVRRYFTCGSFIIQMTTMLLTAFTTNPALSVTFISIGAGAGTLTWSGFYVNVLDIAPSHAAFITGIARTFGTISGIITPIVTGYIVTDKSREQWQIVFYIAAGLYLIGTLVYWFFMKSDLQSWAKIDIEERSKKSSTVGEDATLQKG